METYQRKSFPVAIKNSAFSAILRTPDTVIEMKRSRATAKLVNQDGTIKTGWWAFKVQEPKRVRVLGSEKDKNLWIFIQHRTTGALGNIWYILCVIKKEIV